MRIAIHVAQEVGAGLGQRALLFGTVPPQQGFWRGRGLMRVDFYQLSRDPAEATVPLIARNTMKAGERLLVVSGDDAQLDRIDEALWSRLRESFLAHGRAGLPDEDRQPILLSDRPVAANGARYMAIADGKWREGEGNLARLFFLFDDATIRHARETWKALSSREGLERHFWKQEDGHWIEAA